ncbi:MAG: hypothetical protein QXU20_03115 [Candidatus Woesearchaeota archaeon]
MLQQIIEGVEGFENKVTGNISTRRSISINEIIDNNYKDFTLENINGCEFFCLYLDNEKILMEKNSLLEHLKKHNDLEISEPRDLFVISKNNLK